MFHIFFFPVKCNKKITSYEKEINFKLMKLVVFLPLVLQQGKKFFIYLNLKEMAPQKFSAKNSAFRVMANFSVCVWRSTDNWKNKRFSSL